VGAGITTQAITPILQEIGVSALPSEGELEDLQCLGRAKANAQTPSTSA